MITTKYYHEKLLIGNAYEEDIANMLMKHIGFDIGLFTNVNDQYNIGESKRGIEIKNDEKIQEHLNIYIEYAEKSNAKNKRFVPSGILREDNTNFILIGNHDIAFLLNKSKLLEYINEYPDIYSKKKIGTSRGYVISLNEVGKMPEDVRCWTFAFNHKFLRLMMQNVPPSTISCVTL